MNGIVKEPRLQVSAGGWWRSGGGDRVVVRWLCVACHVCHVVRESNVICLLVGEVVMCSLSLVMGCVSWHGVCDDSDSEGDSGSSDEMPTLPLDCAQIGECVPSFPFLLLLLLLPLLLLSSSPPSSGLILRTSTPLSTTLLTSASPC